MEQFEQLLTCCVCLDRYRNPKLLPCQHSFCMEPCMDGLTDYVRRQVKCPECRAEHRIPYNGVAGFPTNVTLTRFLELHIEITGDLPDPTSGQVMERCNVCSEKAYCTSCMHCEKKICPDCKSAHMDILRREINRINNQIRRGIHRLQDILSVVEKNTQGLQTNCQSVSEEIDEIYRRLTKALKDRNDYLRTEMDKYLTSEMKNMSTLKENLELEIANISSNCDLADKYMNDSMEWEDCELMDTKEIFLKTVEFIRNFECENSDYSRRVRFAMAVDTNHLVNNLCTYGDLNFIHPPTTTQSSGGMLQPSSMSGIMRSKSDHRLATQFRQQQDSTLNDDEPLLGGRKFGERPVKPAQDKHSDSKYGYDYNEDQQYDTSTRSNKNRFRSRFVRGHHEDDDDETRTVKTTDKDSHKEKITSTEDVAKGPLSGIFRIQDSPRVMKRLQEQEKGPREKKEVKPVVPPVVTPTVVKTTTTTTPKRVPPPATRQQSEDDEIARIKRENKTAGTSQAPAVEPERPATERSSILKKTPTPTADDSEVSQVPNPDIEQQQTRVSTSTAQKQSTARSSSESSSSESSSEAKPAEIAPIRSRITSPPIVTTVTTPPIEPEKKPFQSRFLQSSQPAAPVVPKKEETETSSEEESSSEESETEEEASKTKPVTPVKPAIVSKPEPAPAVSTRTSILKDSAAETRRSSRDDASSPSTTRSRYDPPASSYSSRTADKENDTSRYGTRSRTTGSSYAEPEESSYTSRFLNKSKSTAVAQADEQDDDSDSRYGTGRSRYMALKERRNRLARSRSSHNFGNDDEEDEPLSPTTTSPSAYLASRYASSSLSSPNELSRSRSTHALKSREASPDRGSDGDKEALSSWARYLKNKYGNRTTKDSPSAATSSTSAASSYNAGSSSSPTSSSTASSSRRLSLGLPLRQANEMHSSDDDSKNLQSSLASPTQTQDAGMEDTNTKYCTPRTQYLQKRRQILQIGGRGSEQGKFTWPRGISVSDNVIVVADSSNHRVQVFDSTGTYLKEFGTYGNGDGEFDCLAGVAINRIGQFIIADRYNHRIQVFDPSGRFLRTFGSQGTSDGKFNYPWGITTDPMGFIYVCDKENHRIQVFQSDGTFVGKFGSCGSGEGQLEHPHYIAVSNTNRVIVSDSNNHRIQIFDVNGKVLSCFGCEGSEEGQFKFPRGVAVDEFGYICVADSGNNRIQIFHPDGSFLRAFGSWGSSEGEFKGLEGVAIMSNGNILVCDRENHRIQVF